LSSLSVSLALFSKWLPLDFDSIKGDKELIVDIFSVSRNFDQAEKMNGGDLNLPPGFRFHPTDEELVMHYLCRRCAGQPIDVPIITEIDLYKYNPWELPG
jgi:hypothetical protein